MHARIMNGTLFCIFEIRNVMKLMFWNAIEQVTWHHLRHLYSRKYEGYQWNNQLQKQKKIDPLVFSKNVTLQMDSFC